MKKLIVIFLGVLVGSIIPTIYFNQEEILGLAMVLVIGNIVFETFFKTEFLRYLAIFFSSITVGLLSTLLFPNWYEIAKTISLVVFAICAVTITVLIGKRENKDGTITSDDQEE